MLADDALMFANVRAALDPDPARALRYKPFAYGPFGEPPVTRSAAPQAALVGRVVAVARVGTSAVRSAWPVASPRPVPCC